MSRKTQLTHTPRTDIASLRSQGAPLLIAYGVGVDSTAMLVGLWRRGIRPDAILFADTGSERPETYAYLPVMQAWLRSVGFPEITTVRYVPKRFKHAPYSTLEGNCISNATLPSLAFGRKSCSLKWKRAPQDKWTNKWDRARRAWARGLKVVKCIGYDAGPKDARRAWNVTDDEQYTYWYPLRDWGWEREECERQIAAAGLPVPVKSSCFFCPSMQPEEVAGLVRDQPELADRIIAMEAKAAPNLRNIKGLWRNGVKGTRGGRTRPGTMTEYILALRAAMAEAATVVQRTARSLPVVSQLAASACATCPGF